jgi:hypothetical protein
MLPGSEELKISAVYSQPQAFGAGRGSRAPARDLRNPARRFVSGQTRIDSLVATKDPQLVQIDHTPGESGRKLVERMYPLVAEGIANGLFIPKPASTLCSCCPYACEWEAEYGGAID